MDSESIVNKVATILESDTTLKTYITSVIIGDRARIYGDVYPCIVLDVPGDPLNFSLRGRVVENILTINIYPATLISDREKALIGDTTTKGILDIIKDIKTALCAYYPDLTQNCLNFSLSVNEIGDFEDMKGKWALIEMRISYRETI